MLESEKLQAQAALKDDSGAFGPATSVLKASSTFLQLAEGEACDKGCPKLLATQLVAKDAVDWAHALRRSSLLSVKQQAVSRVTCLREFLEKSWRLLDKIPACDKEQDYRRDLGKLSQQMAGDSVKLRALTAELAAALEACTSSVVSCAAAMAQVLTTHVTYFAALTLARSPHLGGKSEQSKAAARQLQTLLVTLLRVELPKTPKEKKLPDDALKSLLCEMERAAQASELIKNLPKPRPKVDCLHFQRFGLSCLAVA